jgi:hypothetical protein
VAVDSQGATSQSTAVFIRMCNCNTTNGECRFNETRGGQDERSTFLFVVCACNPGYEGMCSNTAIHFGFNWGMLYHFHNKEKG